LAGVEEKVRWILAFQGESRGILERLANSSKYSKNKVGGNGISTRRFYITSWLERHRTEPGGESGGGLHAGNATEDHLMGKVKDWDERLT